MDGSTTCETSCSGKECGADGCGGSCGSCPIGSTCNGSGMCACSPACTGRQCGPDGCGGSCGTCGSGTACNASGTCICAPACTGRQCGSDGCGGSCGTCGSDTACNASGTCICVPACSGRQCGSDGCGGSCGSCGSGDSCGANGACEAACTTETIELVNDTGNGAGICSDGSTYTLPSKMYISLKGTRYVVDYLGYLNDSVALGKSSSGSFECCWTDPVGCVGYTATCETTSGGSIPCLCTAARTWSASADSCTTKSIVVCN